MEILLHKKFPIKDGYYLAKLNKLAGLHLVLIQTEFDGRRVVIPDYYLKKAVILVAGDAQHDIYDEAYFSEQISTKILDI